MLLEVQGLTVTYGRRMAVNGLSIRVDAGEIVGLLGPNGAGKTTALLAIAGALAPASGDVRIQGVDSRADPLAARALVGLADQPPTMYEYLTVSEHVELVAEARGRARDPRTKKLLEDLGLMPVADRLIRELSFGFRQRVGLAASLAGDTRVILLDETLNGLDPHASRAARETLKTAAHAGSAILMSTHLLGVAERLCSRLVFMDNGVVVRDVAEPELGRLLAKGVGAIEDLYLSLVGFEA
ncbi:MAG: ABC transporter ATP-binding protein [Deltaproteobacteria bacterium]|nr:ABC transporter ATP-binding protein [Deltaproteobacteria bacterium]